MSIKNAEFYANFKSIEKVVKNVPKNLLKQKCDGNCTFTTFTNIHQTFALLIIFLCAFFKNFFNGFEISMKFCIFLISFWIKTNLYKCNGYFRNSTCLDLTIYHSASHPSTWLFCLSFLSAMHWCQMAEFRAARPKNGPVKFLAA